MQGSLDWTIRVLHFGELWKSKDLANGFAEFPGEIPRSLKILECFCVDLLKQSSKNAVFSQKIHKVDARGFYCKQNLSLSIRGSIFLARLKMFPKRLFGGQRAFKSFELFHPKKQFA